MVTFKINGQNMTFPTSWQETTYKQYLAMFESKDDVLQIVSLFSGIDYETLKGAVIVGVDRVLEALSFINTVPVIPPKVSTCGKYNAVNVQFESLAQFEDMRKLFKLLPQPSDKEHLKKLTALYGDFVAIYLQKARDGQYQFSKVASMKEEVMTLPALEVISLGQAFFLKILSYTGGLKIVSPPIKQLQKKKKPVSRNSKHSAHSRKSLKRRLK